MKELTTAVEARPFLKWAGGKRRLVPYLAQLIPLPAERLVEPFAGSAALSLALAASVESLWLNDLNPELINVFRQLKEHPSRLIDRTKDLFDPVNNTAEVYYQLRNVFNMSHDGLERAALFLYLNRHGYNGLCRFNTAGEFNVPFGRYNMPYFPARELQEAASILTKADISMLDFEDVLDRCVPGDVVYCDPPYVPLSDTASFTDYSPGGFGAADHKRLAAVAQRAAERGVLVIVSNHATAFTEELYSATQKSYVNVRRTISCDGQNRGLAKEVIAVFAPRDSMEASN